MPSPHDEATMTTLLRLLFLLILSACPRPLVAAEDASEPLALGSPDGRCG